LLQGRTVWVEEDPDASGNLIGRVVVVDLVVVPTASENAEIASGKAMLDLTT